jgi:hypothetical protein
MTNITELCSYPLFPVELARFGSALPFVAAISFQG